MTYKEALEVVELIIKSGTIERPEIRSALLTYDLWSTVAKALKKQISNSY